MTFCAAPFACWLGLAKLLQLSKKFFVIRLLAEFIDFGKGDLASFIHNEDRSVINARQRLSESLDAEFLCCASVRPVIAGQRIIKPSNAFLLPREVRVDRVWTDAQDLSITVGELLEISAVRRHFVSSSRTPVQRIKRQDYVFLAQQFAELEFMPLFAGTRRQLKVGDNIACFQCWHSNLQIGWLNKLLC